MATRSYRAMPSRRGAGLDRLPKIVEVAPLAMLGTGGGKRGSDE